MEIPLTTRQLIRSMRMLGAFVLAFGFLYLVVASPLTRQTEISWAVPFGMLPIALLLGAGAWAMEVTDTPTVLRRDGLWALSVAVALFAVLRLAKLF